MKTSQLTRTAMLVFTFQVSLATAPLRAASTDHEADQIRDVERKRLRALVDADVEVAKQLHTDDFQLINPSGEVLSKDQYLEAISSGTLDYTVWEPETAIAVRLHGQVAVIRYKARAEAVFQGRKISLRRFWHTDYYEKRDGRWQIVWSHATATSQ